jgi:hypothetical protein
MFFTAIAGAWVLPVSGFLALCGAIARLGASKKGARDLSPEGTHASVWSELLNQKTASMIR